MSQSNRYWIQLKDKPGTLMLITADNADKASLQYALLSRLPLPLMLQVIKDEENGSYPPPIQHGAEIEVAYKMTTFCPETPEWSRT